MTQDTKKPIPYHYGYRMIHPSEKQEEWNYALQLHKNQNGKHWDLRLHRPGEDKAYSWASKKIPLIGLKPVLATRTFDHNLEHMSFEGPMATRRGYGDVKLVQSGKVKVKKVDGNGILFTLGQRDYRLRPFSSKKYLFEPVLFNKE